MRRQGRRLVVRVAQAAAILARDPRVPKPLRWAAALGLLPIPGPLDEAVLMVVATIVWIFYREPLHAAWRQAGSAPHPAPPAPAA